MSKNKSRDELDPKRRSHWFSSISLKAGFSGLSSQVYILVFLGFLFSLGNNIAFPYLAMFLAGKTQNGGLGFASSLVGLMLMTGGFTSTFALLFTGSLCDRFGRKIMMMSSLIPQILLTIGFAYVHAYLEFLLLYATLGIVMAFFNPAYSAMIADLVQPEKREQVYGLNYMVGNVGFMVGLPIGGLIASMSGFSVLYFYAAIFVSAGAAGLGLLIKESKPLEVAKEKVFSDVTPIFRDRVFILFCFMGALTIVVYSQLYSLLSVYTGYLGFEPYFFGFLSSIAGAMVVTLQIPIRLGTVRIGPTKAFIIAETLFGAGFICLMFAANFSQFLVAIALLTIGEIIFFPASSAFVANLAPADMRGRYLALMGLFFGIGGATAELTIFSIYGLLANKSLIWGIWGTLGFAILPGYLMLFKMAKRRARFFVRAINKENEECVKMSHSDKEDPVKTHREGTAYFDGGNYKEAKDKFLQASHLYEKVQDFFDSSYTLFKAAECSFFLKDYETAVESFLEAADRMLERGYDRFGLGALEYASDCYKAAGKEGGKRAADLRKRIADLKKKLEAQAF